MVFFLFIASVAVATATILEQPPIQTETGNNFLFSKFLLFNVMLLFF